MSRLIELNIMGDKTHEKTRESIISRNRNIPMGPTGFRGLNAALRQRWVLKQDSLRPPTSHGLLKMLILSGLNEA